MARILRTETSLRRRQAAIARELAVRHPVRIAVWAAALALLAWGALHAHRTGAYPGWSSAPSPSSAPPATKSAA
jgi:hypothetical protein